MSICTLAEVLQFCGVDSKGTFTITAANDTIYLSYDSGSYTACHVADGTYEGSDLATTLQTSIDAALSISSTVSYSSTTYKFTIAVSVGHTIALQYTNSDMAFTLGFTEDASAAVSITSDTAVPSDPSTDLETIHDGVEKWVIEYCRRTFDSTSRTQFYDGTGDEWLYLKEYPITTISRVSIGRENAVKIKNTSDDATRATVSISSTTMTLIVTGGSNAGTNTITLTSFATLTLLIAQINTLGGGWEAELDDSDLGSISSSELVPVMGKHVGARPGETAAWEYLEIPEEPTTEFDYDEESGELYYAGGFGKGRNNVCVTYTAGYSTMPDDLKLAVMISCKALYRAHQEDRLGVSKMSITQAVAISLEEGIFPRQALDVFDRYKKVLVG